MTSVVIASSAAGSRALVSTAETVAHQGETVEILLAVSGSRHSIGVIHSIVGRLGAAVLHADNPAAAVNAAVQRATGRYVMLVSAPWTLERGVLDACVRTLDDDEECAAVVPTLRVQSPDGRPLSIVRAEPTLSSILAEPRAVAPVVALRRDLWLRVGGFDDRAGNLASCDWWLRFLGGAHPIAVVEEPMAVLTAGPADWWPPVSSGALDLDGYRAVLEKHRTLLEREMFEVLVERELAFGRLMAQHREVLHSRDEELAQLERLRAETAHHRAYLQHHGFDGFDWGDFRRPDPISRDWGYDRGVPIDRHYIETFLAAHSSDVRGAVLEVQEDDFTRRFGGPRVTRSEVVDLDDSNPRATIVADLRSAIGVDGAQFDCIILTQTLHVIDDMPAVLRECCRLLKPGGVLLATLPCASRVCLEYGEGGDVWRVTPAGAKALCEPIFGPENVECSAYGSVLTNVAFLHGLACDELTEDEFAAADPYHPMLVGVRARKQAAAVKRTPAQKKSDALVLLYHRVADEQDVHDLSVPAALLEEQLTWLARNSHVMPLNELLDHVHDGLPPRSVAITFDDGYLDTLEGATPLLQRLGLPATVFATTRWLDEAGEYWWDFLERALLEGPVPTSLSVVIDRTPVTLNTRTPDERRAAHDRLHSHLVHATLDERDRIVTVIGGWAFDSRDGQLAQTRASRRCSPMTADELRRLARVPGISIGAHGVNHLALPDQTPDVQQRELEESALALQRVLGRRIEMFAHPYGAVNRATRDLARVIYRWSVGCQPEPLADSFDAADVPRVEAKRWDGAAFADQLERLFRSEGPRRATVPQPV